MGKENKSQYVKYKVECNTCSKRGKKEVTVLALGALKDMQAFDRW